MQIRVGFWSKGGGEEAGRMPLLAVRAGEYRGGAGVGRGCAGVGQDPWVAAW